MKKQIDVKANESWDLDNIYPSFHVWLTDYKRIENLINNFSSYQKKVAKNLFEVITELLAIEKQLDKLVMYSKLKYDLNCLNDENNSCYNKIQSIMDLFNYKTDFVIIEIIKMSDSALLELYKKDLRLLPYQFLINKKRMNKKHYLSLKEENILSLSDNIRNTQDRIFDKLNDADVNFGMINNIELTHGNYHNFITDNDQNNRKLAFEMYHQYYQNHSNTLSECLISQVKNNIFESKIRKFSSPLAMHLNPDQVSINTYDNIIKSVHNNLNLLQDYMQIKKDALKLDGLNMYDIYVPLNSPNEKTYSYEEAKSMVLNSLKPMGDEFMSIAASGLNDNWVDVYPAKGKKSGAYSTGSYDTKPYILMNFNNSFRSIETLAHELGHSMHSYFSNNNQPYQYCDYSIFLAEIASNTHELLLFDYIKKQSESNKEKKYIIELILDSFKASIFRQTQFAEFEKIIHDHEQDNKVLTNQTITDIYFELNKLYYGPVVNQNEQIRYESLRIPHFYRSFYVYKYAIGLAIAHIFAKNIIDNKPEAVENYLTLITAGDSKYPLEVLKDAKINIENVIDDALNIMHSYLEEYKKLN